MFNLAWNFQILTFRTPHTKIGVWWAARLKFSISLENSILSLHSMHTVPPGRSSRIGQEWTCSYVFDPSLPPPQSRSLLVQSAAACSHACRQSQTALLRHCNENFNPGGRSWIIQSWGPDSAILVYTVLAIQLKNPSSPEIRENKKHKKKSYEIPHPRWGPENTKKYRNTKMARKWPFSHFWGVFFFHVFGARPGVMGFEFFSFR